MRNEYLAAENRILKFKLNKPVRLNNSERVELAKIGKRVAESNSVLPMPEWQKVELEKRKADLQEGSLKLKDWKTTHLELRTEF